jgi:amidohydrolase
MNMEKLSQLIDKLTPEVRAIRRQIHKNPEPAFEEHVTASVVAGRLRNIPGMEVETGVARTGVVAILGREKSGPCIALRADMDCLRMQEENTIDYASVNEGLMHACGHDGHTACLLGTALALAEIQEEIPGPVKFLFQPAEENHGGGRSMVEEGVLENPSVAAIYGLHGNTNKDLGMIGIRSGASMAASKYFTITVHGRGCHAASPHRGIDPVVIGSQIVVAVQSIVSRNINPLDNCIISIPKFTGSSAPNVIPEKVVLEGTLRALNNCSREHLEKRLEELVVKTAEAHGGTATIDFFGGYPLLENDPVETAYVQDTAARLIGEQNVDRDYPPSLGAEDFAFYAEKVPAAFFWLGLQPKGEAAPPLHHPRFDFNDDAIPLAMRIFCELVLGFASRTRT